MRLRYLTKLLLSVAILTLQPIFVIAAQLIPTEEASKKLPDLIGHFKATSRALGFSDQSADKLDALHVRSAAIRHYRSENGNVVSVVLIVTSTESSAYALLSSVRRSTSMGDEKERAILHNLGAESYVLPARIFLAKGTVYVDIDVKKGDRWNPDTLRNFAESLTQILDTGGEGIPVLVKHLPDWKNVEQRALYAVTLQSLKGAVEGQPLLDAVSLEGGAEAVAANYGSSQLVIVEFNTPQLASDNDRRIIAKILELRAQGQSVPTAYRRVGNYSVFVFNAPDEQTANRLIDQVKYEQVVQWLPGNLNSLAAREREYVETTLGVFVSVVKASGLAIVLCFGVGGFVGALLFRWRRDRQAATEAYSDAGGMLRLNIDELTAQTDPGKLIGPGS